MQGWLGQRPSDPELCALIAPRPAQLVNEDNVVALSGELLNYLVVALPEHKPALCDKVRAGLGLCVLAIF